MNPTLNHEILAPDGGAAEAYLLFLHGIYGAGRNWNSVARRVVAERGGVGAVMVDLREHGESMGFAPPHTIEAAARDVLALIDTLDAPAAGIVGHSFGGKVALMAARLRGDSPEPFELWVVDSTPEAREPEGSAWGMLDVLRAVPGPFADRREGIAALEGEGVARPVAQWLSTNLVRDGDDDLMRWRLDADVMEALMRDFFATDLWDVVEDPPEGVVVHLIKATESSVLGPDAIARVRRAAEATGRVHYHEVEGGHWLNADNPDALVELMGRA